MLGDSPWHWNRHRAEGGPLGFGKPLDPLGDALEARAIAVRETRERVVELRALVK
jgi:hypothetical protein